MHNFTSIDPPMPPSASRELRLGDARPNLVIQVDGVEIDTIAARLRVEPASSEVKGDILIQSPRGCRYRVFGIIAALLDKIDGTVA